MSNIIPFQFKNQSIRIIEQDGEPWFVLADVCKILDLDSPTKVKLRLDVDDVQVIDLYALNQIQGNKNKDLVNVINESGLYDVVLRSDKPEAKPFRKWVTSEVLPSIRKTGSYSAPQAEPELKTVIDANKLFKSNLSIAKVIFKGNQAILSANQATKKLTHIDVLENLGAKALIAETKDVLLTATDIGQQIGLSAVKVNLLLEEKGFMSSYRDHKNRKQHKLTEMGESYGVAMDTGKKHGNGTPVIQIKWYSRIIDLLKDKAA